MEKFESYTVSHTSFESILKECALTGDDILQLPEYAAIVEVGSGERLEFAQGIKGLGRNDLQVVSIDPTLAISPKSDEWYVRESGGFIDYHQGPSNRGNVDLHFKQKGRLNQARKVGGALAAKAPDLPLRDNSVDLLIDSKAAALYLPLEGLSQYLKEIERVLKPGGKAVLAVLGFPTGASDDPYAWREKSTKEIEEFLEGKVPLLAAEMIHGSQGSGVRLTKKQE